MIHFPDATDCSLTKSLLCAGLFRMSKNVVLLLALSLSVTACKTPHAPAPKPKPPVATSQDTKPTPAPIGIFPIPSKPATTLRLPHIFSDNMVLQQGMNVPVWGWAKE